MHKVRSSRLQESPRDVTKPSFAFLFLSTNYFQHQDPPCRACLKRAHFTSPDQNMRLGRNITSKPELRNQAQGTRLSVLRICRPCIVALLTPSLVQFLMPSLFSFRVYFPQRTSSALNNSRDETLTQFAIKPTGKAAAKLGTGVWRFGNAQASSHALQCALPEQAFSTRLDNDHKLA